MSNFDPSLDELVSAYVDGEATDAEIARVEADPELVARANIFASLDAIVAEPPAPPANAAAARERAIAAALAASKTTTQVTSLAPKQAKPSRFGLPNAALLSAAAVLFVLIAGFAVINNAGGGSEDMATTADSAEEGSADVAEAANSVGAASPEADDAMAETEEEEMVLSDSSDEGNERLSEDAPAMEEESSAAAPAEESSAAAPAEDANAEDPAKDTAAEDPAEEANEGESPPPEAPAAEEAPPEQDGPIFASTDDIRAAFPPAVVESRLFDRPNEAGTKTANRFDEGLANCTDSGFQNRVLSLELVDIVGLAADPSTGIADQTVFVMVSASSDLSEVVLFDLSSCAELL